MKVGDAWLVNVENDPFILDGGGGSVYVPHVAPSCGGAWKVEVSAQAAGGLSLRLCGCIAFSARVGQGLMVGSGASGAVGVELAGGSMISA